MPHGPLDDEGPPQSLNTPRSPRMNPWERGVFRLRVDKRAYRRRLC